MGRLIAVIAAIVLAAGTLAVPVAAASSTSSGSASIAWEKGPDSGGGGSGGGGTSGGTSSGGTSGGGVWRPPDGRDPNRPGGGGGYVYDYNRRSPASNVIVNPGVPPQTVVSIPNPQAPLGKLPATGGNYLIPLLFLAAGMSFLLVFARSGKWSRPP